MKKLLCMVVALMLALTAIGALAEVTDLPREETLYFGGQQVVIDRSGHGGGHPVVPPGNL